MNGLHIHGTPLVVDYWRIKNVPPRALYFLTHLHADHTSGLSSQWPYPIHCRPVTARLLRRKFKIRPDLIVELEVGESRLLHVEGSSERVSVSVTVLDANHCPGSAMFLFAGYFGRILYTGDFRYSPAMAEVPELAEASAVDILYLDNTYCHPSCKFPSRAVATDAIVDLIRENGECTTLVGLHSLGKEELLVAIAKRLGVWVGVSSERYETLRLIEANNVFTTDMDSCFVRVLPLHVVLKAVLTESFQSEKVLTILPTCIFSGENAPPLPSHPSLKVVPYSDHSSYDELLQFVSLVRPRSVRPIVKSFSGNKSEITASRCNMSVFYNLLDPTHVTSYKVPEVMKCLFAMHRHDNKPLPIIATPITRKSLTPANGRGQRKQATGVCYLSPTKEGRGCGQSRDTKSHDTHVTEEGEKEAKSTVDIFKTPQILPRRVPLEPKMVQCPPKPVFPPVVRALSEPRQSSAIHSTTFYGATSSRQQQSRKRSRSVNGDTRVPSRDLCPPRTSESGGRRRMPASVTRPMWVTRVEREWGVAMDDVVGGVATREGVGSEAKVSQIKREGESESEKMQVGERRERKVCKMEPVQVKEEIIIIDEEEPLTEEKEEIVSQEVECGERGGGGRGGGGEQVKRIEKPPVEKKREDHLEDFLPPSRWLHSEIDSSFDLGRREMVSFLEHTLGWARVTSQTPPTTATDTLDHLLLRWWDHV